jgi:hypothetical protein
MKFGLIQMDLSKKLHEDKPSLAGQPKQRNEHDYTRVQIMQLKAGSIIINIRYFELEQRYLIMIHKDGELYFPKLVKLEAKTCKTLMDNLYKEYEGDSLQEFVGLENRILFESTIKKIPSFFSDCP